MQPSSPPRLQRYLSSGMLALCLLFSGAFFTPTSTKAATLYTDFATWAANAGTITNTSQFDWYEYGLLPYPGLTFTLDGGTTLEFSNSTPYSLIPGEPPHDGLGNYLWGGNPDAHAFYFIHPEDPGDPLSPIHITLSNNDVAGGFWITVQRGLDLRFAFAGIDDPLVVTNETTQFIGWVGQDMTTIDISSVEFGLALWGVFYIGDFFEGTGPVSIPEPAPLLLLALGCLALLTARRTPWVGKIRPT